MASLNDIPDELLHISKHRQFLIWLKNLPTDDMTKKELLFLWAEFVGHKVTHEDMLFIFGPGYRDNGI